MHSGRIYSWLLHAYPAGFREEYAAEMLRTFEDLRSHRGAVRAWACVLADLLVTAPKQQVATLAGDVRLACRKLAAAPSLVILVMLTLGLGMGANTAIYSLMDALLFRPLPAKDPARLITVRRGDGLSEPASYPDYVDFRDRSHSFESMAAFEAIGVRLGYQGSEERVMSELISGNFFPTLGFEAAAGRLISPSDDIHIGGHPVAVIGYGLWMRRFAGAPDIVGEDILVNSHPFTIIGVAPKAFRGASIPLTVELWTPLAMYRQVFPAIINRDVPRAGTWLTPIGRLKRGVSLQQAEDDLNAIERQIQAEYPQLTRNEERRRQQRRLYVSQPRGMLIQRNVAAIVSTAMMVVTGLLLLIACVNVANLLLARATTRQREVAIRVAMGASRRRLIRQLLTESVLLSALGAAAGCLLAWWGLIILGDLRTPVEGPWQWSAHARLDFRVLCYALLVAVATGIVFGLTPALRATRLDLAHSLKEGGTWSGAGRESNRLRSALVTVQLALSVALLVGTGLLVRTVRNLQLTSPGFETNRQLVAQIEFGSADLHAEQKGEFLQAAKQRIRELPGVESLALVGNFLPLRLRPDYVGLRIQNRRPLSEDPVVQAGYARIEPEFFGTVRLPLIEGRLFREDETGVAIVNQTLAARYWPRQDPIGQTIWIGEREPVRHEIIGVARDAKYYSLNEDPVPFVYWNLADERFQSFRARLFVRTAGDPARLIDSVRRAFAQVNPTVEIREIGPAATLVDFATWPARLALEFLGLLSLLGLLLGAAGLYGVMSYTVEQWRHEMGIRLAIGARSGDVGRLVMSRALRIAALGVACGMLLAVALTRTMRGMLAGVSTSDPATYLTVAAILFAVTLLACAGPAHRASRVDPMHVLRQE